MRRKTAAKRQVQAAHEIPAGKLSVSISNALTTAAQSLSLAEKRVMMFAVAKLDSFKLDGGTKDGWVRISAADYSELYGVGADAAYLQLKAAGNGIFNRYIRFFEPSGKGMKEVKVRWVSRAEYHHGEGWIALRFTQDVAPYITNLQRQFTTYKLAQASALRSLYSWRLLELLSQFPNGWRQIDLVDFHFAMETPEGYKANFKILRQRVIEPAVRELTEKDGWSITWEPLKTGRKVTSLRFEFSRSMDSKEDLLPNRCQTVDEVVISCAPCDRIPLPAGVLHACREKKAPAATGARVPTLENHNENEPN